MGFSTLVGIFLVVWGCALLWGGIRVIEAQHAERLRSGGRAPHRRARARVGVLLAAFGLMGIGLVCFGVTVLRYASGYVVAFPVRGPLVDQIISIAGIALPVVGFIALFVAMFLERPRRR